MISELSTTQLELRWVRQANGQLFADRHFEWLRQLNHPTQLGIPTLRSIVTFMEVALGRDFVTAIGEGQQPAPRGDGFRRCMVAGQASGVDKRRAPSPLDMRFPAVRVVWSRVSVCSEP